MRSSAEYDILRSEGKAFISRLQQNSAEAFPCQCVDPLHTIGASRKLGIFA